MSFGLLGEIFQAWANELSLIEDLSAEALKESRPAEAVATLENWEDQYQLPSTGTESERQARLVTRRTKKRRVRPVDYQQKMAPVLGLSPSALPVIEISSAEADAMADRKEIYRFFIYRAPEKSGTYSVDDAQVELDRFSQSHTSGHVIESVNFLCDDEFSLCDRDILEAEYALVTVILTETGDTLTTESGDRLVFG